MTFPFRFIQITNEEGLENISLEGTLIKCAAGLGVLQGRIHSFCGLKIVWLGDDKHLEDKETANLIC